MLFKIGDKVKVVKHKFMQDLIGVIISVSEMGRETFYGVVFQDYIATLNEEQLAPVMKERIRGFEKTYDAPEDTQLPVRGSNFSAGYDFFAPCDIIIPAHGKTKIIFFNIKAYMQADEFLYLRIRSSLGAKHCIMLESSNVIDADYYGNANNDGNIGTVFRNHGNEDFVIKKGERCCQGIFMKFLQADNSETLGARKGGYGSTNG